jgi:hypothetical protein
MFTTFTIVYDVYDGESIYIHSAEWDEGARHAGEPERFRRSRVRDALTGRPAAERDGTQRDLQTGGRRVVPIARRPPPTAWRWLS